MRISICGVLRFINFIYIFNKKLHMSNNFLNIEIEFKYWACIIRYKNITVTFWTKKKNMETEDPHLGPSKGPNEAKSRPKWSPENWGPNIAPNARRGRRWKWRRFISSGSVDPCNRFKIIKQFNLLKNN